MSESLFATVSGCQSLEANLEILANNLANAQTTGFKRDNLTFESMLPRDTDQHQESFEKLFSLKAPIDDTVYNSLITKYTDHTPGPIKATNVKTDLALEGRGFFKVKVGDEIQYTRDGSLTLDAKGMLVTREGHPVLGRSGEIRITDPDFILAENGEVLQHGKPTDMLDFPGEHPPLLKIGANRFVLTNEEVRAQAPKETRILQGRLEGSNVQTARSMTELIAVSRLYEAYNRTLQNYDKINSRAVVQIAKV